ncbi:MAG: S8 family serine peptidase [Myxococcota bacterium]
MATTADPATGSVEPEPLAYVDGQWLVAPPPGRSLASVADAVGGEVVAPVGRSGFGLIAASAPDAGARLAALGARSGPVGRTVGTGKKGPPGPKPPVAWHLAAIGGVPSTAGLSGVTVAVLDTGVAYETSGRFVVAPGLATTPFVAPADFVELDGHPNDDHQHGTHIASLIASRATYGGVAPGVAMMPIKVLDAHDTGTEWALVEGLWHAIDNGADVINLSLSFPLGYVPSEALQEALEAAWDADIVVIAAAGNESARELTWPAASRLVVAVGASSSTPGLTTTTAYTDLSPALSVLAPGGSMSVDFDRDGYTDGILAETIDPTNPARTGFWFYQGTSQAAALASGAAAHLLATGIAPHDVANTLTRTYDPLKAWLFGAGPAGMNVGASIGHPVAHEDVYVGLLPYLAPGVFGADPRARVVAVDAAGEPIVGATVLGTVYATTSVGWRTCTTGADGACNLSGTALVSAFSSAWAFRIDAVVVGGVAHRPSRALFATDGGDVVLAAAQQQTEFDYDALAVYWPGGLDPVVGPTNEAWAVVDAGVGLLSSPLGVLFTPAHVSGLSVAGSIELDVDGTGLLSSPLGTTVTARTLTLDGSGLLSSPLGTAQLHLLGIDGSGLLSSPLGFHATQLYAPSGSGLMSSPLGLGFTGQPMLMGTGTMVGGASTGSAFEALIEDQDGLRTVDGYEPATWLLGSGVVDAGTATASVDGLSSGVVGGPGVAWP